MSSENTIERKQLNEERKNAPTKGDIWFERIFVFNCLVVKVDTEHNVIYIAKDKKPVDKDHYEIDLSTIYRLTKSEFIKRVEPSDVKVKRYTFDEDYEVVLKGAVVNTYSDQLRRITNTCKTDTSIIDDLRDKIQIIPNKILQSDVDLAIAIMRIVKANFKYKINSDNILLEHRENNGTIIITVYNGNVEIHISSFSGLPKKVFLEMKASDPEWMVRLINDALKQRSNE